MSVVYHRRHEPRRVVVSYDSRYRDGMVQPISVRLDDEAERALRSLEASGLTRSEAVRTSLIAEARRRREHRALAREVAALEADEADRAELLATAELMESMRAPG